MSMAKRGADSRERLERAALELYRDRGYGDVTAAEIAEHAGLTERTFFRHFADKPEMLFAGGTAMEDLARTAILASTDGAPLQRAMSGLQAVVPLFEDRLDLVRERQRIIAAHVDLQERELSKRSRFSQAVAAALVDTGVDEAISSLAGALSCVIFHDAFTQWVDGDCPDLTEAIARSASRVREVAAGV
jgi:AcrR family transcriptional regulator